MCRGRGEYAVKKIASECLAPHSTVHSTEEMVHSEEDSHIDPELVSLPTHGTACLPDVGAGFAPGDVVGGRSAG